MPKFMLLQNYEGGQACSAPMAEWSLEEIRSHIAFQQVLNAELLDKGEFVDAQGLSGPELAKKVVSDGVGAPVVTDGPYPETQEVLAGYTIVDVSGLDRAVEIAAAFVDPGADGQYVDLRPIVAGVEELGL